MFGVVVLASCARATTSSPLPVDLSNGASVSGIAQSFDGSSASPLLSSRSYKVLHRFKGGSDAASPFAGLTNVKGTLYGTTEFGGTSNFGTVFKITTIGKEHVLYSFKGYPIDGEYPKASLTAMNETLYGTTSLGGNSLSGVCKSNYETGCGIVFKLSMSGNEDIIHSFVGQYQHDGATRQPSYSA